MKNQNKTSEWYDALNEISQLLAEMDDMPFFLDSGTLLGFIRSNDFIEWDNDIDIGIINYGQQSKDLIARLKSIYGSLLVTKWAAYVTISGINIGINFYNLENGYFITNYWRPKIPNTNLVNKALLTLSLQKQGVIKERAYPGLFGRYKNILVAGLSALLPKRIATGFVATHIEMLESKIDKVILEQQISYQTDLIYTKVPKMYLDYLLLKYGKDWRVPKKNYVYFEDDGSLVR